MMQIRKAQLADAQILVDVIAPFVEQLVTNDDGRKHFQIDAIQTIFDRPDIHYYLGFVNDQVVGMVAYIDPAHLMHYFVKEEFQGQGFGRELWTFVEQKIQQQPQEKITVKSSQFALKIYEKLGFVVTGELTEDRGLSFTPMCKYYSL